MLLHVNDDLSMRLWTKVVLSSQFLLLWFTCIVIVADQDRFVVNICYWILHSAV